MSSGESAMPSGEANDPAARPCRECGQPLAAGAAFCRACGAPTQPPAPTPPAEPLTQQLPASAPASELPSRGSRAKGSRAIPIAIVAGLLVGGGVAAAILLIASGDSKQTKAVATGGASTIPTAGNTTPTRSGEASSSGSETGESSRPAAGSIEAGRYVQAGSFRTVEGAETEQGRLREAGIDVDVVESDQAKDLYPGFQVLLGGPFFDRGSERDLLEQLHDNGVPSAFGRALSPAPTIIGPEAIAGSWTGTLERTGTNQEGLNGSLPVTLTAEAEGDLARLEFSSLNCTIDLPLRTASAVSLTYGQTESCVGGGAWSLRPEGASLSIVLLPPDTDVIVLGDLSQQ